MTTPSNANARAAIHEWTRVSSFKPQVAAVLLLAAGASAFSILLEGSTEAVALAAGALAAGAGLIALACKVVHRRGRDYRISTLFYREVVTVDDVCLAVTKPGPLWMRFRIHLRRPARFGWTISFVPVEGERRPRTGPEPRLMVREDGNNERSLNMKMTEENLVEQQRSN